MARWFTIPFILIIFLSSLAAACGGNPPVAGNATAPATAATPVTAPLPTATATAPPKPAALPAGSPSLPATTYPARTGTGEMLTGEAAQDRIAQPGTNERVQFEAVLAGMGTDAPTDERVFILNTSDPEHPNWTYLPGNSQRLYVAVVREGGVEKIDPSLHDWRVGDVTGVEMARWQEVTPPPGADNLRLVANGTTTVIGAFQGDTLVYWLSTEANNGQGDWRPDDSTMPEGAGDYRFDAERNTWVTQVGEVEYAYEAGQWVEVEATATPEPTPMPQLGAVNEANQWWDGGTWQALPEGEGWQIEVMDDQSVKATDGTNTLYRVDGQWLTEAQVETKKVVEYVATNSEVINRVPMDWITLRATRELQEAVRSGLPSDEQQYESPLFAIVTDVQRLEQLLSTLSIDVVGEEQKVSLGDRSQVERVEFVFMSGNEELGFRLPVNYGHSTVTETQFGAYKSGMTVYLVMKLGDYISAGESYSRADREEGQFFIDGVVNGLWKLTNSNQDIGVFSEKFRYDSAYDANNQALMKDKTWLVAMYAVRPERLSSGREHYTKSNFFQDFVEWIPPEFQPIIEELNW